VYRTSRRIARLLGLEALAVAPTAAVLWMEPSVVAVMLLGGVCLALGYFLLRLPSGWPLQEGAWLGLAVGGCIGLAQAEAAAVLAAQALDWMRPWLITVVACSGIGIALGTLAHYDLSLRLLRRRRQPAAERIQSARLK
jgi:hypothetical protein